MPMRSQARLTGCLVMTIPAGSITAKPEIGSMRARRPVTHTDADAGQTVQASDEKKEGARRAPPPLATITGSTTH